MESSCRGSLLVRAAARQLLNPAEGCPPTWKYRVKEHWLLSELLREDLAALQLHLAKVHAAGAQILPHTTSSHSWTMYDFQMDRALLLYQRVGALLQPWDDSWKTHAEETEKRLRDRGTKIPGTDLTREALVKLIKEYEEVRLQRQGHAS